MQSKVLVSSSFLAVQIHRQKRPGFERWAELDTHLNTLASAKNAWQNSSGLMRTGTLSMHLLSSPA